MAKFYGVIGYGESLETAPGVVESVITERKAFGDVLRNTRQLKEGDKVNNDLTVNNSISIVADAYANEHFFAIRYISWMGTDWIVTDVDVQRPRLILRLGGVYNGQKGRPASAP
jgi:hypothetical protein